MAVIKFLEILHFRSQTHKCFILTAINWHQPLIHAVLNVLWLSNQDWEDDVRRFKWIFRHPSDIELVVLIGNHDIGFHNEWVWGLQLTFRANVWFLCGFHAHTLSMRASESMFMIQHVFTAIVLQKLHYI